MATVTTTSAPAGEPQSWIGPVSTGAGVSGTSPLGKIIFADTFTVAAKDAANESEVIMTAVLPPGYFYRPSLLAVDARGITNAAFNGTNGFELGLQALILENGIQVHAFGMFNVQVVGSIAATAVNIASAMKVADDAVTNDFQAFLLARQPIAQILINASQGTSTVRLTWMDTSGDATGAVSVNWRLEVMRYTIEQGLSWEVNAPTLTYDNSF